MQLLKFLEPLRTLRVLTGLINSIILYHFLIKIGIKSKDRNSSYSEPLLIFDKLKNFIEAVLRHRPNSEIVIYKTHVIPKGRFLVNVKDKNLY